MGILHRKNGAKTPTIHTSEFFWYLVAGRPLLSSYEWQDFFCKKCRIGGQHSRDERMKFENCGRFEKKLLPSFRYSTQKYSDLYENSTISYAVRFWYTVQFWAVNCSINLLKWHRCKMPNVRPKEDSSS